VVPFFWSAHEALASECKPGVVHTEYNSIPSVFHKCEYLTQLPRFHLGLKRQAIVGLELHQSRLEQELLNDFSFF
jgi:hypothetical protein